MRSCGCSSYENWEGDGWRTRSWARGSQWGPHRGCGLWRDSGISFCRTRPPGRTWWVMVLPATIHTTRGDLGHLLLIATSRADVALRTKSWWFPEGKIRFNWDLGLAGKLPCLKSPGLGVRSRRTCMALEESCPFAVKWDEKEANLCLGFTGRCTFGSLTAEIFPSEW